MNKVIYSPRYGGFGLSDEASELFKELSGEEFDDYKVARHNPFLIKVVETLGGKACSTRYSDIKIVEIPGCRYLIDEHDGYESIQTPEQTQWDIVDNKYSKEKWPEFFL